MPAATATKLRVYGKPCYYVWANTAINI